MIRFCSALISAATYKIVKSIKSNENNNKNVIKKYDEVEKSVTCDVDGVYATPIFSCKSFNQLQEILRSA